MNILQIYKQVQTILEEEETRIYNVEELSGRKYITIAQNFPVEQQDLLKNIALAGFTENAETADFRNFRQDIHFKGHIFHVIFQCGIGARFALLEIHWDVPEAKQNLNDFVLAMNRNFAAIKMQLEEAL